MFQSKQDTNTERVMHRFLFECHHPHIQTAKWITTNSITITFMTSIMHQSFYVLYITNHTKVTTKACFQFSTLSITHITVGVVNILLEFLTQLHCWKHVYLGVNIQMTLVYIVLRLEYYKITGSIKQIWRCMKCFSLPSMAKVFDILHHLSV